MSKRKKAGRTKSQSEIHVEADEKRREAHARLVLRREGDPAFVQQTRTDNGRTISWDPDSPTGADLAQVMEEQRQGFIDKFGREPGPEDPLFFDPDSDEPTFLDPVKLADQFSALRFAAEQAGLDPAFVTAWEELGYIVTEDNQHLFSAMEVDAWNEAVSRALAEDTD